MRSDPKVQPCSEHTLFWLGYIAVSPGSRRTVYTANKEEMHEFEDHHQK